jgi:hypothetical protein
MGSEEAQCNPHRTMKSLYKVFEFKDSPLQLIPLSNIYVCKMNADIGLPTGLFLKVLRHYRCFCASVCAPQILLNLMTLKFYFRNYEFFPQLFSLISHSG